MFDGLAAAFNGFLRLFWIAVTVAVLSVPLAIWKLVDIAIWMFGE